jgi:hypothetical protein
MKIQQFFLSSLLIIPSIVLSNSPSAPELEKSLKEALGLNSYFGKWEAPINLVYDHDDAPNISQNEVLDIIREAADEWETVSGVKFNIIADSNIIDDRDLDKAYLDGKVRISWLEDKEDDWAGRARTYESFYKSASGYFPLEDGHIELNSNYTWSNFEENVNILVHELGHLIGLGHSDNPNSVMYANPYNGLMHPRKDDIETVQKIYGKPSTNIDPNEPVNKWLFNPPPKASSNVTKYLFKANQNKNSTDAFFSFGEENTGEKIEKVINSTPDESSLFFNYGGLGNLENQEDINFTPTFVLVDPLGYKYSEWTASFNWKCDAKISCYGGWAWVANVSTIKTFPGNWKYFVLDQPSRSSKSTVLFETTIKIETEIKRNLPPQASIQILRSNDGRTTTFSLNASDPENDNIEVFWYTPHLNEQLDRLDGFRDGRLREEYSPGKNLTRTFSFPDTRNYSVFIQINDDGDYSYGEKGSASGRGFRTLLRVETSIPSAPIIPYVPTGVSASEGTSSSYVTVKWNSVSGATSYDITRCTTTAVSSCNSTAKGKTGTSYNAGSGTVGTTYYYRVRACNSSGCSDWSDYDTGYKGSISSNSKPSIPTGVSASDGTSSSYVTVKWNSVSGATKYDITRCTSTSVYSCNATAKGKTGTSYNATSGTVGTTYYYRVRACNSAGCSDWSNYDTGYKGSSGSSSKPSIPTGVSASDGTSSSYVTVKWNSVNGATSYDITRCTTTAVSSCNSTAKGKTRTSHNATSGTIGTTYYYRVRACNISGCSDWSDYDTGYKSSVSIGVDVSENFSNSSSLFNYTQLEVKSGALYFTGNETNTLASMVAKAGSNPSSKPEPGNTNYYSQFITSVVATNNSSKFSNNVVGMTVCDVEGYRILFEVPIGSSSTNRNIYIREVFIDPFEGVESNYLTNKSFSPVADAVSIKVTKEKDIIRFFVDEKLIATHNIKCGGGIGLLAHNQYDSIFDNFRITDYGLANQIYSSLISNMVLENAQLKIGFEAIGDSEFDSTRDSSYYQQNKITALADVEDVNFAISLPQQDSTGLADLFILVERKSFDGNAKNYLLNANGYLFEWDGNALNRSEGSVTGIDLNLENLIRFSGYLPSGDYKVFAAYIDDDSELKVISDLDVYTTH